MSTRCTVCTHPRRAEIARGLTAGLSYRDLEKRHAVSRQSLGRHVQNCLSGNRSGVPAMLVPFDGDVELIRDIPFHADPVAQVKALRAATLESSNINRRRGDEALALAWAKEAHALLKTELEVADRAAAQRDDTSPQIRAGRERVAAAIKQNDRRVMDAVALLDSNPDIAAELRAKVEDIKARRAREARAPILELVRNDPADPASAV